MAFVWSSYMLVCVGSELICLLVKLEFGGACGLG